MNGTSAAGDVAGDEAGDGAEGETKTNSSAMSSVKKNMVVVYGDSGTGKTAFVCRILDASFCIQQDGPWKLLNDRVLARHMCTVNDSDSLDPLKWAKSLAGQIFEKLEAAKAIEQILKIARLDNREQWLTWFRKLDTTRKVLNECLLPMLNINGIQEIFNGLDLIVIDSLDEASTYA